MGEPEVYVLKVSLASSIFEAKHFSFRVEIPSTASFLELHEAIQEASHFENDHLFEFYLGKNTWDQLKVFGDSQDPNTLAEVPIQEAFPITLKGVKLLYHFDYGDDWLFEIRQLKQSPKYNPDKSYPVISHISGERPIQYPDYDDEL